MVHKAKKAQKVRAALIFGGLTALALISFLTLTTLEENLVFFRSPSDLANEPAPLGKKLRVGGLVLDGSVVKNDLTVEFDVTDLDHDVSVRYTGILPDLFREGQGVVVEGAFDESRIFIADTVLAKHDETYMPPEVAEALKESGKWQGDTYDR